MSNLFGRSEMEAYLGRPALDDGHPSLAGDGFHIRQPKKMRYEKSLDELSPLETAAHLAQNVSSSEAKDKAHRYRTNRVLQHHQLAAELLQSIHTTESQVRRQTESDSEGSFVTKQQVANRRLRTSPEEVNTLEVVSDSRKARHLYASSSSESESEASSSDPRTPPDSSEDDVVTRRQQRKRSLDQAVIVPSSVCQGPVATLGRKTNGRVLDETPAQTGNTSESSAEGLQSSSSADSSESDDESSMEDARPQFIPRKRRRLEKSYDQVEEADDKRSRIRADRMHSRKLESRAMVAKQVAFVAPNSYKEHVEESFGALNILPNDADISDKDAIVLHHNAWELREIERLLTVLRQEREKERRQLAYQRRKQLTDEQVMIEDRQSGRYIQPGKSSLNRGANSNRYYHRGAYYMDEEEWDDADVRYKSADYAQAATGEDKLDKSMLPKILQKNKFGFARQNTKYKGLVGEDTSETQVQVLPIVGRKKKMITGAKIDDQLQLI